MGCKKDIFLTTVGKYWIILCQRVIGQDLHVYKMYCFAGTVRMEVYLKDKRRDTS